MTRTTTLTSLALLSGLIGRSPGGARAADLPKGPRPKVVLLEPGDKSHLPLLGGPPETASMRSGLKAE